MTDKIPLYVSNIPSPRFTVSLYSIRVMCIPPLAARIRLATGKTAVNQPAVQQSAIRMFGLAAPIPTKLVTPNRGAEAT